MIRIVKLILGITMLAALSLTFASNQSANYIVGNWSGHARFFDRSIRAATGPIVARLSIADDFRLSGQIGDAGITATLPHSVTPRRLEYRVKLTELIRDLPALQRTHLIILVTIQSDQTLDADFHLKSRFGFDSGMRVGHFDVSRTE